MGIGGSARWREDLQVEILQKRRPRIWREGGVVGQYNGRYLNVRGIGENYGKKEFWMKGETENEGGSFQHVENVAILARMKIEYMMIGRKRSSLQRSGRRSDVVIYS